ncbi:hypothetical protein DLR11_25055 [Salmonella enterica subsp. salamae]|uniref:SWIM-type domain-containing protein n=1 Tax=Salmonella enterica subsp. salamae TaxID=59202 RepID=A0A5Y3V6L5_SALER|nr:hypothetical protein [Salmonella enterica subsp. salamae]EEO8346954.1 hypothetical protein [Salmonella enterica]ECI3455006.1 hypothetical protein [Salmonella enterica subsp. salamae]ECJ2328629.1 hypothetical protein [Salmonella enterica subsp. salamae]EDV0905549.1 hypothetical protein [Salmonella enterica subsp. salamae]
MVEQTVSLSAGSPKCSCENPDTCTHMVSIEADKKTYSYKQGESLQTIYLHDADAKGVMITASLIEKSCISKNPDCPSGVIYNDYHLTKLKVGSTKDTLKYLGEKDKIILAALGDTGNKDGSSKLAKYANETFPKLDVVTFLSDIVLDGMNNVDKTTYYLQVGECIGEPVEEKVFPLVTPGEHKAKLPPYLTVNTDIIVYPRFEWSLGVNITHSSNSGVKTLSDDERYDILMDNNSPHSSTGSNSMSVGKYAITRGVQMDGNASISIGGESKDYSKTMTRDFTRYKAKLTLLTNAERVIDYVSKMYKGGDDSVQILAISIQYPVIKVSGDGKLLLNSKNIPYLNCGVGVSLDPLIDFTIKFDFLQAFAKYFHVESILKEIREKAASGEGGYKKGENSAYGKVELALIVSGKINLSYRYQSDENNDFHSEMSGDGNKGELSITLESKVEAGMRVFIFNGLFIAEGEFVAKGLFELNKQQDKDFELIFFHEGVRAMVHYKIIASVGKKSDGSSDEDAGYKREGSGKWMLCDKLEKDNSPYRVSF